MMVVLGERYEAEVSSNELASTGDGGRVHVVADHGVCVPRGLDRGDAREQPFLWAPANHLCRRTKDWWHRSNFSGDFRRRTGHPFIQGYLAKSIHRLESGR